MTNKQHPWDEKGFDERFLKKTFEEEVVYIWTEKDIKSFISQQVQKAYEDGRRDEKEYVKHFFGKEIARLENKYVSTFLKEGDGE